MKRTALLSMILAGLAGTATAQPLGTAFTYQGRLTDAGNPAVGTYDLQFVLMDAPAGGSQVGPLLTRDDVVVTNGLFVVSLDFGTAFTGTKRWLDVGVRAGASTGTYAVLSPRQELTPSPNAVFSQAVPWTGVSGKPAGFADDIDNDSGGDITAVNPGSGLTGGGSSGSVTLAVDPAAVQSRVTGTCPAGSAVRVVDQAGTVSCETDDVGWSLTGNAGMVPGTHFIGTTDDVPFEIRLKNERAVRIERVTVDYGSGSSLNGTNVLAGYPSNFMSAGVMMATIAGGGGQQIGPGFSYSNQVFDTGGTIGGGGSNYAGGGTASVEDAMWATVAGGQSNRAQALGATVGGGRVNRADGILSTVPGGLANTAGGAFSLAAGSRASVRGPADVGGGDVDGDQGTFVWGDSTEATFQSTGPDQFLIRAAGGVGINTDAPTPGGLTIAAPGKLTFGSTTRQMIDLWGSGYGIGVQSGVVYFRSDPPGGGYAWFLGGSHADGQNDPGPGGIRQMRLDGSGNLFVRGSVNPGGADFAEMLPAEAGLEPGDVLAIARDGQLERSTVPYQTSLAGVYSTQPGLLGGAADGESAEGKVPLAVAGIVPVKVTDEGGPILPGDALTSSSTPGHAMKAATVRVGGIAFFPSGVVVGKALEPLQASTGVIRALVVLQ